MDSKQNICYKRKFSKVNNNNVSDRKFLIDFIIATYLGPDVNSDNPRFSALQRLISGLPSYKCTDLGSSYVTISLLERLYYYLLRFAPSCLLLDIDMFHMYLKGKLLLPDSEFCEGSEQFTSIFPLDLHPQVWYPESFRIVKGVVLIDDPITACIKEEDLMRFRSLAGVKSFKLDVRECLRVRIRVNPNRLGKERDRGCVDNVLESSSEEGCQEQECKRKFVDDDNTPSMPDVFPTKYTAKGEPSPKMLKSNEPALVPLISIPDIDNCAQDSSLVLTGTAKRGLPGPSVGAVDIGISKAAYLFRVSLPGVKKEYNQFSCDIESDGTVQIRGLVAGGRTITKQSRVFQMKTQQLCSPGPFTLSFNLPGPVDPRLFAPNFRPDGIFEGVVIKL